MDGLYEEENCSLTFSSLRGRRREGREKDRCTIILIHVAEPSLERLEPASLLI